MTVTLGTVYVYIFVVYFLLGTFPVVWILYAEISEHPPMKTNRQSFPKRRNIKFRRRRITQKKANNIQNTVTVWNRVYVLLFSVWVGVKLYRVYQQQSGMFGENVP
jgi:hypothetical protein